MKISLLTLVSPLALTLASAQNVPLSPALNLQSTIAALQKSLNQAVTSKDLDGIYNHAKAVKGLNTAESNAVIEGQASAVCGLLNAVELKSISDNFNYQKNVLYFDCQGETTKNEDGSETKASRLDLSRIEKAAFDKKIDPANLYKAISILKKGKFINSKNRNDLIETVAKVYEYSGKSLLASAFTINSLIELGGPKLGAKFVAMEANIGLPAEAMKAATEYDNTRLHIIDQDTESSSFILRTIIGLARVQEEKSLTNEQIIKVANYFLTTGQEDNLAQAVQALNALNVEPSPLPKPVSFVRSGKFPNYNFKMSNVFGQNVDSARFTVKVEDLQDQDVAASGAIDLSNLSLTPGFYSADVTISGASSYVGVLDSSLTFKFGVTRSGATKIKSKSLTSTKKGEVETTKNLKNLKSGDKVTTKFEIVDQESGSTLEVQQAFVRFYHAESGLEGFTVAKYKTGAGYSSQINLANDFKNVLGSQEGEWSVEAILGDNSLPEPISIDLGTFSVDMQSTEEARMSLKQVSSEKYSPERLIEHTFREPDSRPPTVISLVFTAVTLAPLLILVVMWPLYGVNFKLFSFSLSGVVFHVSFTATLLLYVLYWLRLNMMQTVNYLIVLAFFMVFSGHRLLSSLAKTRRNEANEKGKKTN